jgi:hypothetical protein
VNLGPLIYWIRERHEIWRRRQDGELPPWTDDPVLQTFRFCNVFRELDKVTIWIDENIRKPFADHEHLWFMLAIARQINRPETLKELMDVGDWPFTDDFLPGGLGVALQNRKNRGEPVYTGAYMIRAESDERKPWYKWTKQRYMAEIVLGRLWEDREKIRDAVEAATTSEEVWKLLAKDRHYIGWGPFMTYEWTTDLTWTRYLRDATDRMTWANPGPGALRGLARLSNNGALGPKPKDPIAAMRDILAELPAALPSDFPALELRDVEHSLCEVDKYLRIQRGEGRPRATYP